MAHDISGKRVAILATDGFEGRELREPKQALDDAGAQTTVVSPKTGEIKAWDHDHWGESVPVDRAVSDTSADDYDALMIPGGVMNPDKLRMNERAVDFVRQFFVQGKPVGAICHGPWMLVEADVVRDRAVTSWPSLRRDLQNAGARWEDAECVVDKGLVTSRKPEDIPAFNRKLIEEIKEGRHAPASPKATMR